MVPATLLDDKVDNKIDDKASNTVKFDTFEPLISTERLSTVSSPFMVLKLSRGIKGSVLGFVGGTYMSGLLGESFGSLFSAVTENTKSVN